MRRISSFLLFLFVVPCIGYAGIAEDSLKLRPSYQKFYKSCLVDKENFKIQLYGQVYSESIAHSLKILSSTEAQGATVATRGITPYLDNILQNSASTAAIRDCLGSSEKEFALVRNLLIADSLGRIVGISAAVVGLRHVGLLFGKIGGSLFGRLPHSFAKRAYWGIFAFGSAIPIVHIYQEKKRVESLEDQADDLDIEKNVSSKLRGSALDQIQLIDQALQDRSLSEEQIQALNIQRNQWRIVLNHFGN